MDMDAVRVVYRRDRVIEALSLARAIEPGYNQRSEVLDGLIFPI